MKRLRARFPRADIRYYACGEYGEINSRPHFHVCLFGFNFPDKDPWSRSASGFQLWKSALLDEIWGHGHCTIGDFTFETKRKEKEFFVDEANRAKKRFWLIYGVGIVTGKI